MAGCWHARSRGKRSSARIRHIAPEFAPLPRTRRGAPFSRKGYLLGVAEEGQKGVGDGQAEFQGPERMLRSIRWKFRGESENPSVREGEAKQRRLRYIQMPLL